MSKCKTVEITFLRLSVRFFFLHTFVPMSCNSVISYSDHYPMTVGTEKVDGTLYSQSPEISNNGMLEFIPDISSKY